MSHAPLFRSFIDSLENNEKNKVQIESAIKEWVKNRDEKMISIPGVGHIIKRVLKAVYYCTKNDTDFDPQKAYASSMVPKSMLEQK